jgi:hypothetical protein
MFKSYDSKPIQRLAVQIKDASSVKKVAFNTYCYTEDGVSVTFKAYIEPIQGDWVVRLTAEDTYHCTDSVFRDRNIVPE